MPADRELDELIEAVDNLEADDWEDTTREERYWAQTARTMAKIIKNQRKL